MSEGWVTVQEAEEILGVTEATIRRRVKKGVLERKDKHGRVFVKIIGGGRSDGTAPGDDGTASSGDGVPSDGDGDGDGDGAGAGARARARARVA